MKSQFLWICMVILLVIPKPIAAQDASGRWSSGCDSQAQPVVASTTKLDYGKACKTYKSCTDADVDSRVCQMRALLTLQDGCADARCQIEAEVYAAAITVFDNAYNFDRLSEGKTFTEMQTTMPKALGAFQDGKYNEAAEMLLIISPDVYTNPMMPLIAGLSYAAAGESDKAMQAYDQAVQESYLEPISYYVRGSALAISGQHEAEAAIDFNLLDRYTVRDEILKTLVNPLVEAHPFPDKLFEIWNAYPVLIRGAGSGDTWMTDETQNPARAVRIAKLDGDHKIVTQNLPEVMRQEYDALPDTLVFSQQDKQTYNFNVPYIENYGAWGGSIQLKFEPSFVEVSETARQYEGYVGANFVVAPVNESDPRPKFDAVRCPGAALSWLKIGEQASGSDDATKLTLLYDQIDGTSIGEADSFTILDGPQCKSNHAWWQVKTDDGATGWVIESEGNDYQVFPSSDVFIPPLKHGT